MTKRKRAVTRIGPESMRRARERPEIREFPDPIWNEWEDPPTFAEALDLQMRRHRDGAHRLRTAIAAAGDTFNWATIRSWRRGQKEPQSVASLEILGRIEARYRLPAGYFRSKLGHATRATTGISLPGVSASERRRLIWHLPDDYDRRSQSEQQESLAWVRRVIISGSTEYRRFQALAIRDRYAIRFKSADGDSQNVDDDDAQILEEPELARRLDAPASLQSEMDDLLSFKTATLTAIGYQRSGVWGAETASQKLEHLGLLFGALAAAPAGRVRGLGTPIENLSFGLLVFPAVWDWYVQWRERRRGFYTRWEVDMLRLAIALTRKEFGWIRQSPNLARRLCEVPGLVSAEEMEAAKSDWPAACDRLYAHGLARAKEIERVARAHRDPFEPILPILEAESPLAEYRAITEEILRRMPDARRYPKCAAEAARSFLMLRLGLHLGVRQKNLRQLVFQPRNGNPTPERILEADRRGELRWCGRD